MKPNPGPYPYIEYHTGTLVVPFTSNIKHYWWRKGSKKLLDILHDIDAPSYIIGNYTYEEGTDREDTENEK